MGRYHSVALAGVDDERDTLGVTATAPRAFADVVALTRYSLRGEQFERVRVVVDEGPIANVDAVQENQIGFPGGVSRS